MLRDDVTEYPGREIARRSPTDSLSLAKTGARVLAPTNHGAGGGRGCQVAWSLGLLPWSTHRKTGACV